MIACLCLLSCIKKINKAVAFNAYYVGKNREIHHEDRSYILTHINKSFGLISLFLLIEHTMSEDAQTIPVGATTNSKSYKYTA